MSKIKPLTLAEYKYQAVKMKEKVYAILSDDSAESTVYVLHEKGAYGAEHKENGFYWGIFKKFSSMQAVIKERTVLLKNDVNDVSWFRINKYILDNDQYKDILHCDIDIDGEIIEYSSDDEKLIKPHCRNVERIFENGDIIKKPATPFSEESYGVYIYDEKCENRHIETFVMNGIYYTGWLEKLEIIEMVENCPIEELNRLSQKIKEEKGNYKKVFHEMEITMDFLPFQKNKENIHG